MTHRRLLFTIFAVSGMLCGSSAAALDLQLPVGARLTAERVSQLDSFFAPVASFDGVQVPSVEIEGRIVRRAWRIASSGLTPLQVMKPIRDQLEAQGYVLVFDCAAVQCGGFDFRFDVEVLPGPNMYVDISEYRYLTAVRGDRAQPDEVVGILASVTAGSAYVQVITADAQSETNADGPALAVAPTEFPDESSSETPAGLAELLLTKGYVDLRGLEFDTGTSQLGAGPFPALAELSAFMENRPQVRIALVGHTDTIGSLENNIALSRARAQAVRSRIIEEFGIDADRLEADGVGYLAPIATNLTDEGRTLNRRVEAVLISG